MERGTKYAANFWIHLYEFQDALRRGCDNEDYYQDDMHAPPPPRADATGAGGMSTAAFASASPPSPPAGGALVAPAPHGDGGRALDAAALARIKGGTEPALIKVGPRHACTSPAPRLHLAHTSPAPPSISDRPAGLPRLRGPAALLEQCGRALRRPHVCPHAARTPDSRPSPRPLSLCGSHLFGPPRRYSWRASCAAFPAFCDAQGLGCTIAPGAVAFARPVVCEPAFVAWSGGAFVRCTPARRSTLGRACRNPV